MGLNEDRHHNAWEAQMDAIERDYLEAAREEGHEGGLPSHAALWELYESSVSETTYLFNEAFDDIDFEEALRQRREVCHLRLLRYRARREEVWAS
jgi:hypothetical protein